MHCHKGSDIRILDKKNLNGKIVWTKNARLIPIRSIKDFQDAISSVTKQGPLPAFKRFNHMVYTVYITNHRPKKYIYSQLHFVEIASADKLTHFAQKKPLSLHHRTSKFLHQTLESLVTIFTFIKQRAHFLPFRNSKLTHILKDCLLDTASTTNIVLFLTIVPLQKYLNETLKTLRFGEQIYFQCTSPKPSNQENIAPKRRVHNLAHRLPAEYPCDDEEDRVDLHHEMFCVLHSMKEMIARPLQIKPADIDSINRQIAALDAHRGNGRFQSPFQREQHHDEATRLRAENAMLRDHIEGQNRVISNLKMVTNGQHQEPAESVDSADSEMPSTPTSKPLAVQYVDSKLNDIELELERHSAMFESLQRKGNDPVDGGGTDIVPDGNIPKSEETVESVSPESVSEPKPVVPVSNELEKVLASRHQFEAMHL